MNRRTFVSSLAWTTGALSGLAAAKPTGLFASPSQFLHQAGGATNSTGDPGLLHLCRSILKQNLLKTGEKLVVATGYIFRQDYVFAMLQAGAELGALVMHVPVFPKEGPNGRLRPGLTMDHWKLYADADLLVVPGFGAPRGVPGGASGYGIKIGDHEYPTDRAFIHRVGSKTRWLSIGFDVPLQKTLFSNEARKKRAIRGAEIMHDADEVRITSEAGSDWVCNKRGHQGHCQYGFADVPGRWDVYGTGCVACSTVKTEAEGVLVFEPGDILLQMTPQMLPEGEKIKLTWRGGEIVKVDGTRAARHWDALISSYNHPDARRVAHTGFGINEATRQLRVMNPPHPKALYAYHHNDWGSLLFALGNNCGHGGGGAELNYSGLGMNADACGPNHTHFSFHGKVNMWCDNTQVVKDGDLVPALSMT